MRLEDFIPSEPAEVSCHSDGTHSTLVFIREIRHEPKKVWSALTVAEKICKWAPYKPDRDLDALGPVMLRMIDGSEPELYPSEVLQHQAISTLEYSWGDSGVLLWELAPCSKGTRLTLSHTLTNPEWITPSAAGWHLCLDIAELQLDGQSIGPILAESAMDYGWQRLADHYGKILGTGSSDESDNE